MPDVRQEDGLVVMGPPAGEGTVIVVAVHGRDQEPGDLVESLVDRVDDDSVTWWLPTPAGTSWYPGTFQDPVESNEPWIGASLRRLDEIGARLDRLGPEAVVWAGFSQGACLVCEHVATSDVRWGGLLAFTGGRLGPPGTELTVMGAVGDVPVYLAAGDRDPWMPIERVIETGAAFEAAEADVRVEVFGDDGDHHIRDREIDAARRLLSEVRATREQRS